MLFGIAFWGRAQTTQTILVNVASNRHTISDLIYGVAFANSNDLKDLNVPLNRSGGNAETRYNWQINAHNRAGDWYFESIGDSPATAGAATDGHIQASKNGSAQPMLTVPMIGWLPKLGANRAKLASYSTNKYGPQTGTDSAYFPSAGNGISVTNSAPITWNDPNDASTATDSSYQQAWVEHLTNRWGTASNGGVRYYCMDNEWSIWHATHRDVHPVGSSMREMRDRFFDYGGRVKSVDPTALVLGPEEWGWSGYLYSGYDQQWMGRTKDYNPAHFPDRGTNAGWDYLPWFLDQCRQRASATGQRLLDVFSVHYYPQGGEYGSDVSTAMQNRRNRSTRSLWDTNYTDETWINSKVQLIPRLKQWVAAYYPSTRVGITEYNWGAENHMNGATAQADVVGIFGREGLDLATRWTTPSASTPAYKAIKMYRNYDGARSQFGDVGVFAGGTNPDTISTFAAQRSSDGALTIMLVNKTNATTAVAVTISNLIHNGFAQQWVLQTNAITRRADVTLTNNILAAAIASQSIALFVIPWSPAPRLRAEAWSTNFFSASLAASPGARFRIETATNLSGGWTVVVTNSAASNTTQLLLPATNASQFYRAVIE